MLTRRSLTLAVLAAGFLLLSGAVASWAQPQAATATVTRVTGQVEVLSRGQTLWVPLAQAAQLSEGAQVRSFKGGSAELALPDSSTILVAENTRYALTRMEVDPQTGGRNIMSHLVVGKVVARVRQAAVQLVRTRQSNFAISTPSGVAAVRGTEVVLAYDPATNTGLLFVLPSPGQPASAASVMYIDFATGTSRVVAGGYYVVDVAGQVPGEPAQISTLSPDVQQQVTAVANAATADSGAITQTTVLLVSDATIQQTLATLTAGPVPQTADSPPPSAPSSTGADLATQSTETVESCSTPPCP